MAHSLYSNKVKKIDELINRSKKSFEADPKKLTSLLDHDSLVRVHSTPHLILEPIWLQPIDDIEGPIYRDFIRDNPKYDSIFLRQRVADRLYTAAENLPSHLRLVIRAGHRPLHVQRKVLKGVFERYLLDNPLATHEDALTYARIFVDDPAIKFPSHCCGSAVDVDLFDTEKQQLVDFGCQVNTPNNISFLHSNDITEAQYASRMILLTAMLSAGFAPSFVEWWHFSYGDRVWAYFYKKPQSLYGVVEPDL